MKHLDVERKDGVFGRHCGRHWARGTERPVGRRVSRVATWRFALSSGTFFTWQQAGQKCMRPSALFLQPSLVCDYLKFFQGGSSGDGEL